jgi:hypothetical protein
MKNQTNRKQEKVGTNTNANAQAVASPELTEDQLEQVAGGAEALPAVQSTFQKFAPTYLKISF